MGEKETKRCYSGRLTPKAFLKECTECGTDIHIASEECPYCGAKHKS